MMKSIRLNGSALKPSSRTNENKAMQAVLENSIKGAESANGRALSTDQLMFRLIQNNFTVPPQIIDRSLTCVHAKPDDSNPLRRACELNLA